MGLDSARGLAVIGMVLVNFMVVFSYELVKLVVDDPVSLDAHSPIGIATFLVVLLGFAGRAVAVFLVLFGIGMALQAKKVGTRAAQVRRYLMLMIGGYALLPIWEADILHFIGLYGLLVLPLVKLRMRWLLTVSALILVSAELLRLQFDYEFGWATHSIGSRYADMWSLAGQVRQLFFNGYHPVLPWLSLVIYGLCLGRLDLRDRRTLRRLTGWGLFASAIGFLAQALGVPAEFFPADTLFILLGATNATWVIAVCLLQQVDTPRRLGGVLANMGRLALSHYPAHVLLGVVPVMLITRGRADMPFEAAFGLAVLYLAATAVLGQLWLRHHLQGPLERLLRLASIGRITRRGRHVVGASRTPPA